ncbi:MAG TPA: hypothetical protein VF691_05865 [Cytophagaceae bacterium]|jgi:hemolysin III
MATTQKSNNSGWSKKNGSLKDGGPIYTETDTTNFVVEPFNALSSLAFLLPAFYWLYRLRKAYFKNLFIICCIPLLLAGGIGSTLFHAFRATRFFLFLDFAPILILTVMVSIFLWNKLFGMWWNTALLFIPIFASRYFAFKFLASHDAINFGYFLTGVMIFLPILLLLIKHKFLAWKEFLVALLLFSISLGFRRADSIEPPLLSMGTHWLWHLFGAAGCHYLALYLHSIINKE